MPAMMARAMAGRVASDRAIAMVASPIPSPPIAVRTAPIQFAAAKPKKPSAVVGMPTMTAPVATSSQRCGRRVKASAPASGSANPAKWKWTIVRVMTSAGNPKGWIPSRSANAKAAPTARKPSAATTACAGPGRNRSGERRSRTPAVTAVTPVRTSHGIT